MYMGARSLVIAVAVALSMSLGVLSAGAAPVPFESVDVTLHQEQGGAVLMISGKLPKGTKLPAEVQLAAPKGAEIQWAGEILGGNPSEDPSVEPKVTTKGDQDLYTFTLTKSLTGQVEVDGSSFVGFDGSQYAANLAWSAPANIPELTMSVRLPVSASVGQLPSGVEAVPGPDGYTYYQLTANDVKAGTAKELGLTYSIPAGAQSAAPGGAAAGSSSSATDVLVPLVLVVAFVGVVYVLARKKYAGDRAMADTGDANAQHPAEGAQDALFVTEDDGVAVPAPETDAAPAPRKKLGPAVIVSLGIIVVLVVSMTLASRKSAAVTEIPGGYMQEFTQGDACSSVVVNVDLEGKNPEKTAAQLFEAVKPTTALRATLYTEGTPRLEVGFCESQTTPEKIKAALAPTGLIAE